MQIDRKVLLYLAESKLKAAILAAESAYNYDLGIISAITGSSMETFANLGPATEDSAKAIEGVMVNKAYPTRWYDITEFDGDIITGLKVTVEEIPHAGTLRFVDVGMSGIRSTQISAFAGQIKQHPRNPSVTVIAMIYIRFKGGGLYRYLPMRKIMLESLYSIAKMMSQGQTVINTLGEYVNRVIKDWCEGSDPKAICEKYDPSTNTWNLTLSQWQKSESKKGHGDDIWRKAIDFAKRVHLETDDEVAHTTREPKLEEVPFEGQIVQLPEESGTNPEEGLVLDLPPVEPLLSGTEMSPAGVPTKQVLEEDEAAPQPNVGAKPETQSGGYGENAVF